MADSGRPGNSAHADGVQQDVQEDGLGGSARGGDLGVGDIGDRGRGEPLRPGADGGVDKCRSCRVGGAGRGRRIFVINGSLELGRRPVTPADGASWYVADGRVSGRHAMLNVKPGGREVTVTDLGSRNGTFVNGARLTGPAVLRDGDLLMLGRQAAVFRWVTPDELLAMRQELHRPFGPVPALAPRMAAMLSRLRKLAVSEEEILLSGETGVGKEVYAEAIHRESGRPGPFLAINCAALPPELLESELFGFVRGAHSEARADKRGLIEKAERGTLFLDEIGDMPSAAQAKLLRFLQDRMVRPVGGRDSRRIDVRVLAATTRPQEDDTGEGLRADLAGRLGAEPFFLPALRARTEDVGTLLAHFLSAGTGGADTRIIPLELRAFTSLLRYTWPQNVRELAKVARQALLLAAGENAIRESHLPQRLVDDMSTDRSAGLQQAKVEVRARMPGASMSTLEPSTGVNAGPPVDRAGHRDNAGDRSTARRRPMPDKESLVRLLEQYEGNVAQVARHLDRHWPVVNRALKRHGLDADAYRPGS